jgi:hypothetical protein
MIKLYINSLSPFRSLALFNAAWKKLWVASIALATLCGFSYGWRQRSENPPFVITRKTEEPPEIKLLRKGRYDEAAKVALESIKDEKKEYFKYQSVAAVFAAHAVKDSTNREKWAGQAALYIDRSVSLAPTDSINLLESALGTERIGDISGRSCPYYEKARQYAQTGMSQLKGDCIFLSDERVPTQPIRDEFEKLLSTLQSKIKTKCA